MRMTTSRRGFTLIEIMIVAALIALLSGIAVFSIQEFYNSNVRKATIGELNRIGTALEFANQDLGFYPKLNYLRESKQLIQYDPQTRQVNPAIVADGLDYYGYIPGGLGSPALGRVQLSWTGPYYGASQNRTRSNRGTASGITTMRLPDVYEAALAAGYDPDLSVVEWPADPYGNPYVVYQVKFDNSGNYNPVVVSAPGESADYFSAIVSYGPNGFPGGNEFTTQSDRDGLAQAALCIKGDPIGGITQYTLKTASPLVTDRQYLVHTVPGNGADYDYFKWSIKWDRSRIQTDQIKEGLVGMQDATSDDMMWVF